VVGQVSDPMSGVCVVYVWCVCGVTGIGSDEWSVCGVCVVCVWCVCGETGIGSAGCVPRTLEEGSIIQDTEPT